MEVAKRKAASTYTTLLLIFLFLFLSFGPSQGQNAAGADAGKTKPAALADDETNLDNTAAEAKIGKPAKAAVVGAANKPAAADDGEADIDDKAAADIAAAKANNNPTTALVAVEDDKPAAAGKAAAEAADEADGAVAGKAAAAATDDADGAAVKKAKPVKGAVVTTAAPATDVEVIPAPPPPPAELQVCNGVFLTYTLISREKEYPFVKNKSNQAYAFTSQATITNVGDEEVKGWRMYIGFQHREILVSMDGAVPIDAEDFPAAVGNGTTIAGNPMVDLKTAILTANDFTQMSVRVGMKGSQFGLGDGATPMPKTIKLINSGFKCPASSRRGSTMIVCCRKDPKAKALALKKTKYPPRGKGDLTISYDVLQAYQTSYYAEVTIQNNHPLGRLDHWNLTWEWQRGEFIYSMKGAFARVKDPSECLYGPAGQYYRDFDFTQVANCEKRPIISDLPSERKDDEKVGKLPWCCRNGTVLSPVMDRNQARSMFQLQVFKIPPDNNRTALTPPMKWKIDGVINPHYKCGPPVRVDPAEYPDPSGLQAIHTAVASWHIVCNMTKPQPQKTRCCVSFSAFYNESAIPCNTCACGGCDGYQQCNAKAPPMLIPPDALLVPFVNRTAKMKAWAKMKHFKIPKRMPCGDNCPVSINWHVNSDYKTGWTARITLFNWERYAFDDWFTALQFHNNSFRDFDEVYSFNGTRIPGLRTVFLQGFKGLNYLVGLTNGSRIGDPHVPGKQQSVLSFKKKHSKKFNIRRDAFPTKVYFNGEECALPPTTPSNGSSRIKSSPISFLAVTIIAFLSFFAMTERLF
ncbi:COBRA-like protein 10 [Arachis hypogaea]|uniref:COBRA-like protein 10 n=1 Tax=Arachis hypogaea TaxID=3818 RepID=UPI000DEC460B|nr:COBRA-like protein 10 [Arachis hypogaea]